MRVIICGGRDFTDRDRLFREMDALNRELAITAVIEGDAKGVDRFASAWARNRGIPDLKFPAEWSIYGKAAGPIRNQRMLEEGKPDLVLAFPGGRGTADMVRRARRAGIEVIEVAAPNSPPLLYT